MDTHGRGVADPGIKCPLEVHDKHVAHVMADPVFIDGDEKIRIVFRHH